MPLFRRIEVLYVEDSAGDVVLTKQILSEFLQPVKLSVTRDGKQALTMLADERFQPAMIILDLSLPVLSGYDVAGTKSPQGYSRCNFQRVDAQFRR